MTQSVPCVLVVNSGDTFPIAEALEGVGARLVFVRDALTAVEWLALNPSPVAMLIDPTCDIFSGTFVAHVRRHIRFGRIPMLLTSDVDVGEVAERFGLEWILESDGERIFDFVGRAGRLDS